MPLFTRSDGGRSMSSHSNERQDCVVMAIVHAIGLSYDTAWEEMHSIGRKGRCRTAHKVWTPWMDEWCGGRYLSLNEDAGGKGPGPVSVQKFCEDHPVGTYVVHVKGHAFAYVDGTVLDVCTMWGAHVLDVWKIES